MELPACKNKSFRSEESQEIGRKLRGALLANCYAQARTGLMAGGLGGIVILAVMWNEASRPGLILWFITGAIAVTVGQLVSKTFQKTSPQGEAIELWEGLYVAGAAVAGLVWGSPGLLLFPADSILHQFFLALMIAGVACVEVILLSANFWACTTAVSLTVLPIGARFAYEGTESYVTIGVALVVFTFILVIAGHRMHRVLSDSIGLGFVRDDLYTHVLEEKARVESLYNNLELEVEKNERTCQALQESDQRYRALVEDRPDLICRFMVSCLISYVNEPLCGFFGVEAGDLIGGSFLAIIPKEEHKTVKATLEALREGSAPLTMEHRVPTAEGALRWVEWSFRAIFNYEGEVVEFQAVGRDMTDRKKAEAALETSERRFRTLVEAASDLIWTINLDFRFTYVSPAVTRLLGYSVEEIMLMDPLETLTEDSRERLMQAFHEEMEIERSSPRRQYAARFEVVEHYRKDGSIVQVEITATLLRDSSGKPVGVLGISRDITDRKKMEVRVRQTEKRYRLLVEAMNDGLAMTDQSGRFVFVNEGLCQILRYDKEEILGRKIIEFVHGESRQLLKVQCESHQDGHERATYELALHRKDGSTIPALISARRIHDDSGEYQGSISVVRDMEQTRRIENALGYSEEKYRALVENANEAIFVVKEETLTYVNPRALDKWKSSSEELRSKPFWELIHEDDRAVVKGCFSRVLRESGVSPIETRIVTGDSQIRWVQLAGVAISWEGSQAVLAFATDITGLKKVEELLRESHAELQGRVRERTEDLETANEQLVEEIENRMRAQEKLKESEQRYRDLVELLPHMVFEVDVDESFGFLNRAAVEACGLTGADLKRRIGLSDVIGEQELDQLRNEIKRVAPNDRCPAREVAVKRRDGSCFPAIVYTSPICRAQEVIGIRGVAVDITDRKLQEMRLQESERRFRAVFDQAHDCIFIKDRDRKYSHLNPAMLSLMELQECEAIGLRDEDIFGPQQADQLKRRDLRVLQGQVIESEHTLTLGGREVTFDCIKMPLTDPEGTIIGLCGIARDVTEKKASQAETRIAGQEIESHAPAMQKTLRQARLAAKSDSLVLLLGESGSGKDYLAHYIHRCSNRSGSPFFSINCAALAPDLAESELFGHEPGSFTGARGRKRGMVELAEGGTLLLNEIGELSLPMQAKLLTFLDTRMITRVGGERSIEVDARLIAATNRDLLSETEKGRFRSDLFHRLNVFTVHVPSLRERLEDLPLLVESILAELSDKLGLGESPLLDSRLMALLASYDWPGNIRELRNVLERAVILSEGRKIEPRHIRVERASQTARPEGWSFIVGFPEKTGNLNEVTRSVKTALLKEALRRSTNKKKDAARLLGISPDSLKHHLRSLGISSE